MGANAPWSTDDEEAVQIYAFLDSLPRSVTSPVPFSLQVDIADVPAGDRAAGESVYRRACAECHGARSSGEGRITTAAPILPEGPLADHAATPRACSARLREGEARRLLRAAAPCRPSLEALSDADLGALLAYLTYR